MPPKVQSIEALIEALRPLIARTLAGTPKATAPVNDQLMSLVNSRVGIPIQANPRMPVGSMVNTAQRQYPDMTQEELKALLQYAHQAKPGLLQQFLGGNKIGTEQLKRYAGVPAYLLGLKQAMGEDK